MGLLRLNRQRAFTLIELLVVVLIIGILIAIAAPTSLGQSQKAQDSAIQQQLTVAYKAAKADETATGSGTNWSTGAPLLSAINASEPALSLRGTNPALVNSDSPSAGQIGICSATDPVADTTTQLALVGASASGDEFLLLASNSGLQLARGNCQGFSQSAQAGALTQQQKYLAAVEQSAPAELYTFSDPAGSTTLADSSGFGRNATNNGVMLGGSGPFAGAASGNFTPNTGYVSVPNPGMATTNQFTWEGWVSFDGSSGITNDQWFGFGNSTYDEQGGPSVGDAGVAHLRLWSHVNGGWPSGPYASPLQSSGWHYIAMTQSGSSGNLYEDGALVSSANVNVGMSVNQTASTDPFYFGRWYDGATGYYHGKLSDVAVYTTALPASTIAAHYYAATH